MSLKPDHSLITDPIFLFAVVIFAFLTTLLPFILGASLLLPILQTLFLTFLLLMVVRKQHPAQAIRILCIWTIVQLVIATLLSAIFPGQVELAIADGFSRRTAFLEWLYAGSALPDGILTTPVERIVEIIGITVGTLLSAGVLGVWLLVRTINLASFYAGSTINSVGSFAGLLVGIPIWTMLRIVAYIGFVSIFAEPMSTGNWAIGHYLSNPNSSTRKQFLLGAVILLVLSLASEIALSGLWRSIFTPSV